jgi:hypothetical protein
VRFELSFQMDNDAFADDYQAEVARILEDLAKKLSLASATQLDGPLRDHNGNMVGAWRVEL